MCLRFDNMITLFVFFCWQICYFFYKNITFGLSVFLYEAYTTFSGQPAYNDWFLSLYNVFFTSLPVIALGVFDQDVSARFCLKVGPPAQYLDSILFSFLLFNQKGKILVFLSFPDMCEYNLCAHACLTQHFGLAYSFISSVGCLELST